MFSVDLNTGLFNCSYCQMLSVEVDVDGQYVCTNCWRCDGYQLVDQYVEFSGIKRAKVPYSKKGYRQGLYKQLVESDVNDIPPDVAEALLVYCDENEGKVSWRKLKSLLPKKQWLKAKCIAALPKLLGFKYSIHESWLSMAERAVNADSGPTKLNNYFVLYQCVALCGYYTNWIPICLTKAKVKELNKRWHLVCKKEGWDYIPCKLDPYVDTSVLEAKYMIDDYQNTNKPDAVAAVTSNVRFAHPDNTKVYTKSFEYDEFKHYDRDDATLVHESDLDLETQDALRALRQSLRH